MHRALLLLFVAIIVARPAPADVLHWPMDHALEIVSKAHFEPGQLAGGRFEGQVSWDPYVSLRLPAEGIDAAKLTWLTVRMYSSEKADVLDVYYESPDKHWCLGGRLPIVQGWAVYRMDLTKNHWRDTGTGESSKQWGGPSRRVQSLRIDPGNQSDRWVVLDDVRLEPAGPGQVEGVALEPRGTGRLVHLRVPKSVEAGRPIEVEAELEAELPPALPSATFFLRLRRGNTLMRLVERPITRESRSLKLRAELPTSVYWHPGPAVVEAGSCELDLAAGGAAATVTCELTNQRVGTVRPPRAELRPLGGDAAIFVDGKPLAGYAFLVEGGLHLDYHREAARAGVHLYCDWFGTSHHSDLGHVAPDRYDYAEFDRYFAAILDVDPQAWFIPHVGLSGPQWWQQAHPEEMCRFEDGKLGPTSFASERWRREIGEDLRRLIAHLGRAPYADRILGYMFYNGHTSEWQMWGTWAPSPDDFSMPALRAFRAFLTRRYGTDGPLRRVWNDPGVRLDTAEIPAWAKRRPGGPRVLRDPKSERQAVDFYEFVSTMDADALLWMAHITRQATAGRSLVGTYYAYLTAHGINQQDSGHLDARRVFDSPDIDFLMSPPNYWYRNPGEASTFMSATDSLRRRGKLWLDESDHRTHLTNPGAGYGRAENLAETRGVFWRELAQVLTKRAAVSWFDMSGGWFSDPQILADLGRGRAIADEALAARRPFSPEICVLVDPQSFYWMRPTPANAALVLHQVATMPQSGAPWDFCLLDDLAGGRLPDYKLYVFLNAFYVEPARREAIRAKLRRNGATALFVYAPGYLGPQGESLAAMEQLTGIRLACSDVEGRPQILLEPGDLLARGLDTANPMGADRLTVAPIFAADDPAAHVAGRLVDGGRPGLVVKRSGGFTSVYSGAMTLPPGLMRNIARAAGVHIWLETDDALYTDAQWAGVHAAADGVKTLNLPGRFRVTDALTGRRLADAATSVSLPMTRAQTVLLRLQRR